MNKGSIKEKDGAIDDITNEDKFLFFFAHS